MDNGISQLHVHLGIARDLLMPTLDFLVFVPDAVPMGLDCVRFDIDVEIPKGSPNAGPNAFIWWPIFYFNAPVPFDSIGTDSETYGC